MAQNLRRYPFSRVCMVKGPLVLHSGLVQDPHRWACSEDLQGGGDGKAADTRGRRPASAIGRCLVGGDAPKIRALDVQAVRPARRCSHEHGLPRAGIWRGGTTRTLCAGRGHPAVLVWKAWGRVPPATAPPPRPPYEGPAGRRLGVAPSWAPRGAPRPAAPRRETSDRALRAHARASRVSPSLGEPRTGPRATCQGPRPSRPPRRFPGHAARPASRPGAPRGCAPPRAPPHVLFGVAACAVRT